MESQMALLNFAQTEQKMDNPYTMGDYTFFSIKDVTIATSVDATTFRIHLLFNGSECGHEDEFVTLVVDEIIEYCASNEISTIEVDQYQNDEGFWTRMGFKVKEDFYVLTLN